MLPQQFIIPVFFSVTHSGVYILAAFLCYKDGIPPGYSCSFGYPVFTGISKHLC